MKKVHRFFVVFPANEDSDIEIRDPDTVHQMDRVLRLRVGELVVACAGDGREAHGSIADIDKEHVRIHVTERRMNTREPKTRVTLYQAMLKRENMEWVIQKATEIGVACIVPVISDRVIKMGVKIDRWQTIAKEAAEQCERGMVPEVADPLTFDEALADTHDADERWITHTEEGLPLLPRTADDKHIALFVGPEGGWTDEELAHAEQAGCKLCSLGTTILRGETAAVIAVYRALGI